MDLRSKVLIIGGTGYLGKRLVKASLEQGHETYVLRRPEIGVDIEKIQMLLGFKKQGARLVVGSFNDHRSLVEAVKQVDVVICAVSGVHIRSHQILLQLKLVDAIKEAGNIKRFLPSEFGTDPARMADAVEPGRVTFDDKMVVRKAIEEAGIPFTYISANCFAGYMVGGLCQPGHILPSRESVILFGDGNKKSIFVDEDDIATYTIKTIDDPRTLNKAVYIRPPANILSQREVVELWEKLSGGTRTFFSGWPNLFWGGRIGDLFVTSTKLPLKPIIFTLSAANFGGAGTLPCPLIGPPLEKLIGKELEKSSLSEQEFLNIMKDQGYAEQVGLTHYYHVFYDGCLTNFEIGDDAEEACALYPDIEYTKIEDYFKQYL